MPPLASRARGGGGALGLLRAPDGQPRHFLGGAGSIRLPRSSAW